MIIRDGGKHGLRKTNEIPNDYKSYGWYMIANKT